MTPQMLTQLPRALCACLIVAVVFCADVVAASPESELSFRRGVVAYGTGALADARAEFEAALAASPDDVGALSYLALIERAEGNFTRSVELYRAAAAGDPGNADLQVDLATALLELHQTEEAEALVQRVLAAQPDHARARLIAGIAAYRRADYSAAIPDLERALELDPSLQVHARFYQALAEAFVGNAAQAVSALSDVEGVSRPLADRARSLREQMRPAAERRTRFELTAGGEWDSNPTFASTHSSGRGGGALGALRVRGSYDALRTEPAQLRLGVDSYVSRHDEAHEVDLWTSVGSASATYDAGPARFGLLYELSYAQLELGHSFLRSHRVTPSLTFREQGLGIAQLFAQVDHSAYFRHVTDPELERDGPSVSFGLDQYVFLPANTGYLRFGARSDQLRSAGREFRFRGYELSVAAGLRFRAADLTLIYRRANRSYGTMSLFEPDVRQRRRDAIDRFSLELAFPVGKQLTASLELSGTRARSTRSVFAYRRVTVASYLSYSF